MLSFLLLVLLAATVKVLALIAGTFIHPAQPALWPHMSCLLPLPAVLHKACKLIYLEQPTSLRYLWIDQRLVYTGKKCSFLTCESDFALVSVLCKYHKLLYSLEEANLMQNRPLKSDM